MKKNFRIVLALVLSIMMVLSSMSALAANGADAPTKGSITINSPVVGATYKIYKVFDMTTNEAIDSFSYTITENAPFYGAVVAYFNQTNSGLNLERIAGSNPAVYNVSVDKTLFNAQTFGQAMQAVLATGSPAVAANAEKGIVAKDAGTAITEVASQVATITENNTSGQLKFTNTDLGYFLVNPTYPAAGPKSVVMGEGDGAKTFTIDSFVKGSDGKVIEPLALTVDAKANIAAYAEATVDDTYVNNYIAAHNITTNKDGSPLNDAGKREYKADLINAMKADAEQKVIDAFSNENGQESDINVKNPILVFLDSSQPDAVINEKNEIDKWDVPVNPSATAAPGTPDHGEPEGGKNIVVQEADGDTPAYYADWTEAQTGESVHYQLRVNAMNFIKMGETPDTVKQVKEYFLADYQSAQMHFDESKGLHVSIWQGDNNNKTQDGTQTNVTANEGIGDNGIADVTYEANNGNPYLDYTSYATTFFKNNTTADKLPSVTDIFGTNGTGIVVPWVVVSENDLKSTYPIYTVTNVPKTENGQPVYKTENPKLDANNQKIPFKQANAAGDAWVEVPNRFISENNHVIDENNCVLDENDMPIADTKPVYTYSIYNSDVTIVVDYWMILDDDAIVDEPGNKNYAQYGWNPIDNVNEDGTPKTPTNPDEEDKPSQKEEIDEATVYTYAIAWVKTDEKANELGGATFELPFYVKKAKDGNSYVYAFATLPDSFATGDSANNYTNTVTTTDDDATITIKGLEAATYTITETVAPNGYNKLAEPFTLEAKKSGVGVTVKTKTIIYLDSQGNITDTVTTSTVEYPTDTDSFNNDNAAVDEEKSVPVYQYKNIVNRKGAELPSTGGMGTTIFYMAGSLMVLAAAILLITKRRMGAED